MVKHNLRLDLFTFQAEDLLFCERIHNVVDSVGIIGERLFQKIGRVPIVELRERLDRPIRFAEQPFSEHSENTVVWYSIIICCNSDGEWQDAYILGVDEPIQEFTGKVIGVIHRLDDVEDKLVVCPESMSFSKKEIAEKTGFQERFFETEILV